jgi:hypothetical protein
MTGVLSSTFWLLSRNERVLRSLRARIEEVCGRDPPTYDQLKSLTYVRYIINEGIAHPSQVTSESWGLIIYRSTTTIPSSFLRYADCEQRYDPPLRRWYQRQFQNLRQEWSKRSLLLVLNAPFPRAI